MLDLVDPVPISNEFLSKIELGWGDASPADHGPGQGTRVALGHGLTRPPGFKGVLPPADQPNWNEGTSGTLRAFEFTSAPRMSGAQGAGDQIIFENMNGGGLILGDSGSPLFRLDSRGIWHLIGIFSASDIREQTDFVLADPIDRDIDVNFFTSVDRHLNWITESIKALE